MRSSMGFCSGMFSGASCTPAITPDANGAPRNSVTNAILTFSVRRTAPGGTMMCALKVGLAADSSPPAGESSCSRGCPSVATSTRTGFAAAASQSACGRGMTPVFVVSEAPALSGGFSGTRKLAPAAVATRINLAGNV